VAATICPRPCWPWLLTFDLEVGVGVTCDLGYPCAKFRLPRPFGFRVRADVRDIRQTDRRTTDADDRLMPPLRGGGIINRSQQVRVLLWSSAAAVWNLKLQPGTTWITVYWTRPLNAPYLGHVVEYVVTINRKVISSGKSCRICVSAFALYNKCQAHVAM